MDAFKKYQDDLFANAKNEIFITDRTDELEKEIFENCVKIGVPEEFTENISWILFNNLFYEAKQNAKKQLLASNSTADLIFYAWIDEQTGQIRYNFINSNHKKLPFESKLSFVNDPYILTNAFCKILQERIFPEAGKTLVFQENISRPKYFEYVPNKSLGSFTFEMKIDDVRNAVGLIPMHYQKSLDEYSPTDAFDESSIIIHYDKNDTFKALELSPPHQINVQGVEIMGKPLISTIKKLEKIAPFTITKEQDYDFRMLGLLIPKSNKIKYVLVYRQGYWDEYEAQCGKL